MNYYYTEYFLNKIFDDTWHWDEMSIQDYEMK